MAWSKESSSSRGYGAKWQRLREVILRRDNYLCQCDECAKQLVPQPATEVNHKVSKAQAKQLGWTLEQMDAESNLEAVNSKCHERITKLQKGHKPRPTFDANGRVNW